MTDKDISKLKYNQLTPEQQNGIFFLIFKQEENLKNLYLATVERGIKSLFLVNAGGVVTILAYIFKHTNGCSKYLLFISLLSFLLGLMSALLVVFLDFKSMYAAYTNYCSKLKEYLINTITYGQLNDLEMIKVDHIIWIGYLSLACIPFGVLFGLIGYFMQ
jgi:membrane-associated protease RseP (regulator of RpoE activity)